MAQFIPAAGPSNPEFASLQDGLAIVADGNTHAAITSGQYVYVKNHSTLADGLYKATANVAVNGTLSSSNLTADGSGGLNALSEQIGTLNSNINTTRRDISASDSIKDCNDAEIGKCYNVYGSALHTPFPNAVSSLFTYGNNQVKRQFISNGYNMYIRSFGNNTWADWEQLALNSNLTTLSEHIATLEKNAISSTGITLAYNTEYTAETDGYVRAMGNSDSVNVTINGLYIVYAATGTTSTVYVRKGMKLKRVDNNATATVIFFKIK